MPPGTSDSSPSPPPANTSLVFLQSGLAVSVHDTHVVNTSCLVLSYVTDEKVSLLYSVASGGGAPSQSVELIAVAGISFGLFTAQPAKMRGSSCTCEEVKALPARSATQSWSLF